MYFFQNGMMVFENEQKKLPKNYFIYVITMVQPLENLTSTLTAGNKCLKILMKKNF